MEARFRSSSSRVQVDPSDHHRLVRSSSLEGGDTPEDLAAQWITDNQNRVNAWLAVARASA